MTPSHPSPRPPAKLWAGIVAASSLDPRTIAMLPLLAAVFIDLFSFGLMYPVIVSLFAAPALRHAYSAARINLYLSLAFSLFPLGMFFGASLLGDISDAIGRRRTLLICMAGLGTAYLLMLIGVQSGVLELFLAGRLLSGLMAGTSPIAQAAMMDHAGADERGDLLSQVVLVNCVALVSGPAAGGLLGHIDFAAPLAFAMLLCVLAFAWIARARFAEATPRAKLRLSLRRPFEIFAAAWRRPLIRNLALSFFLFQFGFAFYYTYILVRMADAYHLSPAALGLFSATLGAGFVLGSTLFYHWAIARLGQDLRVARLGLLACGAMILLSALPLGAGPQWLLALLAAITNVLAFVSLLALISGAAAAEEQGWALGIGAAMTAASFFLSGLFAAAIAVIPLALLLAAGGAIVIAGILPLGPGLLPVPALADPEPRQ
ncbi:MAG TPA: MFS transporter [Acetobacteraceae bacterium]|nr:MFS transporter [Acetobacteraceae bacterium]